MNLEPERYLCPVHQVDLTDLVRQQLLDIENVDVAFGGPCWSRLFRRNDEPRRPRPFQVDVSCPAAGSPHGQCCEGTYTP